MRIPISTNIRLMRSLWRGRTGLPARSLPKSEYSGNYSDASSDTQASRIIQAVSVTTGSDQPDQAVTSTLVGGNTHKVELKPLPGLGQQFATHLEREIQKQVEEQTS